ncbi:MAG TPA: hypothetical protein VJ862_05275 [Rhodanobacteraceae bacterium]|nr:hypothetical protein [Rhodanobacteraceae bacterium]
MNRPALRGNILALASFVMLPALGIADEPPSSAEPASVPKTLQTVVVTGSHIRGIDLETQNPVVVIDRVEIERTGLTSLSDVVQASSRTARH